MSDENPREKRATTVCVSVTTGVEGDRTDLMMEITRVTSPGDYRDGPAPVTTEVEYRVDGVLCERDEYMAVIETLKLGNPRGVQL